MKYEYVVPLNQYNVAAIKLAILCCINFPHTPTIITGAAP